MLSAVPRTAAWKAGRKAGLKAGIRIRKPRQKKSSTSFASKVLSVVSRTEETKLVAENLFNPAPVVPAAQATPANLARMLPRLTQGAATNQRLGDEIQPVRAVTYFTVFPDPAQTALHDVTVNIAVVRVKGASTDVAVAATPGADFLTSDGGQNTDPAGVTPELFLTFINNLPINKDRYTQLKRFKHRFAKGANNINGAVGAGTNNSPPTGGSAAPCKVFKFTWVPPKLKYDNAAAVLPTNHYPVYMIWGSNNDASAWGAPLKYNVRTELYFKDS